MKQMLNPSLRFPYETLRVGANAIDTYIEFANYRRLVWKSPVVRGREPVLPTIGSQRDPI